MTIYPPDYPHELLINGRAPDQSFDDSELLFIRIPAVNDQGKISGIDIRCPDLSVNRGKYSKPKHVLLAKYPQNLHLGVGKFLVGDIPPKLESGDGKNYDFKVFHDPVGPPEEELENYSHSEIRCFHQGVRHVKRPPNAVYKEFKTLIAERTTVIQNPAASK